MHAAVAIEGGNHFVPLWHERVQSVPEPLRFALVEVGKGDTLLLDPCEIPEIEDALTLALGCFKHKLRVGSDEVPPHELCGELDGNFALIVATLQVAMQLARTSQDRRWQWSQ